MNEAITPITQNELNIDPLLRWQKVLSQKLVQSSGKMVVLMKLLPKLQSGGHKVLIFSQMVKMLELLEELLRFNKFNYERLDGSTSASSRQAAVNRFNKKSYNKFVMLLSTRAGGLGLNLTSADTVIIFDSDWNPQVSFIELFMKFIHVKRIHYVFLQLLYHRMTCKLWLEPTGLDKLVQSKYTDCLLQKLMKCICFTVLV